MSAVDGKIILTENDCYKEHAEMKPRGIVVHSTAADNPYIKRYVQPDDGIIGKNNYGNDWNRGGVYTCVHAFIGYDKNDNVKTYQTLPFDICCWGVGSGYRGSYNYNPAYIQFEMCEDSRRDKGYCEKVFEKAAEFCVYLCRKFDIPTDNIVSHREAHEQGFGSDHTDPSNWWDEYGLTMDKFRAAVKKGLAQKVKTNKKSCLYTKDYKDPAGKSVKKITVAKGTVLGYGSDDGYGWSKVFYKNKTYYIMNGNLSKKGLSKCVVEKLKKKSSALLYSGKKLTDAALGKGTVIKIICFIESGKYRGYRYIKANGKYYYIR